MISSASYYPLSQTPHLHLPLPLYYVFSCYLFSSLSTHSSPPTSCTSPLLLLWNLPRTLPDLNNLNKINNKLGYCFLLREFKRDKPRCLVWLFKVAVAQTSTWRSLKYCSRRIAVHSCTTQIISMHRCVTIIRLC